MLQQIKKLGKAQSGPAFCRPHQTLEAKNIHIPDEFFFEYGTATMACFCSVHFLVFASMYPGTAHTILLPIFSQADKKSSASLTSFREGNPRRV
jgi:hypothetical protein